MQRYMGLTKTSESRRKKSNSDSRLTESGLSVAQEDATVHVSTSKNVITKKTLAKSKGLSSLFQASMDSSEIKPQMDTS